MPARKILPLVLAALTLAILAGCGGSNPIAPRPQGAFTNSSLSGTYAFALTGTNLAAGGTAFSIAGSMQANGSGTITSGTIDINSPGTAAPLNATLTGTYNVFPDGRGTATLTPAGSSNKVNIEFVLLSSQHALVIRFDTFATASGSMDLQDSTAFNLAALAGTNFAFNVSGADAGGAPEDSVGVFQVNTSGTLTSGVQDTSDNGSLFPNDALTAAAGAMSAPGSNGRGTLTISSTSLGARNYAYYVVSANHLQLIEIDSGRVLAGDVFRQTSTTITGPFAFTVSGSDVGAPFVAGGVLSVDASGNVSNATEDTNSLAAAATPNITLTGTVSTGTNGRATISLTATANGVSTPVNYAAYPSSSGLQLLRLDGGFTVSGTAFQQSGSLSNSTINGRYGANVTSVTVNGTLLDATYQLTADGVGKITGAQDVNSTGTLSTNLAVTGTFAIGTDGRSTAVGTLNTAAQPFQVVYYAVDATHILFIEVDTGSVAVGSLSQQQ